MDTIVFDATSHTLGESLRVTADASNRELDLENEGPPGARWILLAELSRHEWPLIFFSDDKAELEQLVKVRRFAAYAIERVDLTKPKLATADSRERSICHLPDGRDLQKLINAGYMTLGEVAALSWRDLDELGIKADYRARIRDALRQYGLYRYRKSA